MRSEVTTSVTLDTLTTTTIRFEVGVGDTSIEMTVDGQAVQIELNEARMLLGFLNVVFDDDKDIEEKSPTVVDAVIKQIEREEETIRVPVKKYNSDESAAYVYDTVKGFYLFCEEKRGMNFNCIFNSWAEKNFKGIHKTVEEPDYPSVLYSEANDRAKVATEETASILDKNTVRALCISFADFRARMDFGRGNDPDNVGFEQWWNTIEAVAVALKKVIK